MFSKINYRRLAEKFVRDAVSVFVGSQAFLTFTDGGVFDTRALGVALGAAASVAAFRVLRDLGVPGLGEA